MSREMSVILLGVAVVIVPYLGIPSAWRTLLLVAAGLALIVIGFLLRAQGMSRGDNSAHRSFVESDGASPPAAPYTAPLAHESHKEGITSLN